MSKRIYVCRECSYEFPPELTQLIDKKVQVFCEKCGSPFDLPGVKFSEKPYPLISVPKKRTTYSDKASSNIENVIQFLNVISFIPLLVVSIVMIIVMRDIVIILACSGGILIALYDMIYIIPKVKDRKYNEVVLHSFGLGILGCIIFGSGAALLLKGILIFFYVPFRKENQDLKGTDILYLWVKSLNNFSAIAAIIGFVMAFGAVLYVISEPFMIVAIVFLWVAIIIDIAYGRKLTYKNRFEPSDFLAFLTIGIFGCFYFGVGTYILMKGVIIFFALFGTPSPPKKAEELEKIPPTSIETLEPTPLPQPPMRPIQPSPPIESPKDIKLTKKEKKEVIEHVKKTEEIKKDLIKKPTPEKLVELKLHESLLPVKNEKDKELVKQYFAKIFAVLSKDIREQIKELKIPKNEKQELLEELAFLTAQEQAMYVKSLINLYRELPKKLISRIRKLPNVKPEHYGKIIEQLKYMDFDEQIRFVEFLEQSA